MAGQVGLVDGTEVGDGVMIGGQAGVMGKIQAGQRLIGSPAMDGRKFMKITALTMRLPKLVKNVKELSARINKLESAKDNKG